MRLVLSIVLLVIACTFTPQNARSEDRNLAVQHALKAADAWLNLIDEGKYRESWAESASFFRSKISADDWAKMAAAARNSLGPLISRKFKLAAYASNLPGAPAGQYVVIEYDASYANNKSVIDKVTPMLDSDGQWRVSGYWIQ